jgi:YfiH family protein
VLTRAVNDGIAYHTDAELLGESGIRIAFSERYGGVSSAPYDTLNLAAHVGDEDAAVNENRRRFMSALGAGAYADRLVTAEQIHGASIVRVLGEDAGRGARAGELQPPIPGTDAIWTTEPVTPLMLFFADCVPVVIACVSTRAIAVVHAGWRGAYAGIVGATVRAMRAELGDVELTAYVGSHIGSCCYEVGPALVSQFASMFVTIPRASDHLDLGAVVAEDLDRAGISRERQWHLEICTAHNTNRFYSYRAESRAGRHCAFAMLEPQP